MLWYRNQTNQGDFPAGMPLSPDAVTGSIQDIDGIGKIVMGILLSENPELVHYESLSKGLEVTVRHFHSNLGNARTPERVFG